MFRNRRILYATIGAAAALLIGMLILFKVMGSPGDSRTRAWNYFNGYVDKVNERNYDIMYYGSEMGLPVEAKFRRIFNSKTTRSRARIPRRITSAISSSFSIPVMSTS